MDSHLQPAAGKLSETVSPHRSLESGRRAEVCEEEAAHKELLLASTHTHTHVCLFLKSSTKKKIQESNFIYTGTEFKTECSMIPTH